MSGNRPMPDRYNTFSSYLHSEKICPAKIYRLMKHMPENAFAIRKSSRQAKIYQSIRNKKSVFSILILGSKMHHISNRKQITN